jgi:aspartokinase
LAVRNNGVTAPEAVRQILTRNYPIYQCLKMGLTNFHSVAEHIQPRVQELTGRKPTINTLVVAIKRFSDTLEEIKTPNTLKALENLRISLTSGIADVTIKARRSDFPKILRELSDLGEELSDFPHVFPLANSIKMILPSEDYRTIQTKLRHLEIIALQEKVAKLSLYLPTDVWNTPGIASYITELLYRNGINIIDAFLGHGDIIIVVNEQDGHVAYDVLRKELHVKA